MRNPNSTTRVLAQACVPFAVLLLCSSPFGCESAEDVTSVTDAGADDGPSAEGPSSSIPDASADDGPSMDGPLDTDSATRRGGGDCKVDAGYCAGSCSQLLDEVRAGACTLPGYPCADAGSLELLTELGSCCKKACLKECDGCPSSAHQFAPACAACLEAQCPQETANCDADERVKCNPITGKPCVLDAGASCDVAWGETKFVCWPPPNNGQECQHCNYTKPKPSFCAPGLTCVDATGKPTQWEGTCRRYCCSDTDCGGSTCTKGYFSPAPELGLCVSSCTGPMPVPSGGSCVPG